MEELEKAVQQMILDGDDENTINSFIKSYNLGKTQPTTQKSAEDVDVTAALDTELPSEDTFSAFAKAKAEVIKKTVSPILPQVSLLPDSLVNVLGGLSQAVVEKPEVAAARAGGEVLSFIPGTINAVETITELKAQKAADVINSLFDTDIEIDPKKDRISTKFLDNIVSELRTYGSEKDEKGNVLDSLALWEEGRYGDAAEQFAFEAAGSLPYTAITWMAPGYGSAAIGLKTFGEEFERNVVERPDTSAEMMALNAGLKGTSEVIFGFIGGSIGKKITKLGARTSAAQNLAKEITGKWIPNIAKKMFFGGVTEGFEEALTSVSQMGADVLTFDENYTAEQYVKRGLHAAALGAVTGAPTSGVMSSARRNQIKKTGLSFIASADWRKKQHNLTTQIDKLSLEYQKAPENQKDYFLEKIERRKKLLQKRQDKLVTDWDNLTTAEQKEYGDLLTEVDNKSDIAFGRSYSEQTRKEAREELKSIYTRMGELMGQDVDVDAAQRAEAVEFVKRQAVKGEGDIELGKRIAKDLGVEFVEIETAKEVLEKFSEKEAKAAGFVKNGVVYINKEQAILQRDVSVGTHEVLHTILNAAFKGQNVENIVEQFKSNLTLEQKNIIERRLTEGKYKAEARKSDEYITQFYNAVVDGEIKYKENALNKIGNFFTGIWRKSGFTNIDFKTGDDIYNFIKDYKKARDVKALDKSTLKSIKALGPAELKDFQGSKGEDIQEIYNEKGLYASIISIAPSTPFSLYIS